MFESPDFRIRILITEIPWPFLVMRIRDLKPEVETRQVPINIQNWKWSIMSARGNTNENVNVRGICSSYLRVSANRSGGARHKASDWYRWSSQVLRMD